ncbi:MAG: apolipoprotein N-acyltransferase [Alphaproteobacteria bacterium]
MIEKMLKYNKSYSFVLGALSVLAFSPYYLIPFAFVAFGLWFCLLNKAFSKKQAFLTGYWFGFGHFAFGFSWIGNALLIDPMQTGWLYPICFLASGAFFGLFFGFPSLIAFCYKNVYSRFFIFITSIVFFEWVRSWIFTGFPWNPIGSVFGSYTVLMQLSSIGGIFFLTMIALYILTLPTLYLITKNNKIIYALFLLIALVLSFGFYKVSQYQYNLSDVKVRLVQPAIPQIMKWNKEILENNFNKYIDMSAKDNDGVNLTIWGETATPFALEFEPFYRKQITKAVPKDGYLITGLLRYEFEKDGSYQPLNSMAVINEVGGFVNHYDKSHLVPFGEYIPLRKHLPEFIKPVTNIIGELKKGEGAKTIKLNNIPSFAASICYEILFPASNVNRQIKPDFLINLTNDGWYGKSSGPYQHLLVSQFRAVEEGLTVIRVANTGISAIISPIGEIISQINLDEEGVLDVYLPKQIRIKTIYSFVQNYFVLILMLLIFILVTIKEKRNGK